MVAQTDTGFDFLADLESLQQPQTQTPPPSNVIQFPEQQAQAPQQTQSNDTYDFLADLEPQAAPPAQKQQAVSEAPDFLSDLEPPKQEYNSPFFESFDAFKPTKKETATEKKQSKLLESFSQGLKESTSGELAQQFFEPSTQENLVQDPTFWESLVKEGGTITGDLPYMAAGAALGAALGSPGGPLGATVGGAFGAMAMPAFLKESLKQYREYQESGKEDLTFGEFLQKADKVANRTLNEGLFGVILGATKKAIPMLKEVPGIGNLFNSKVAQTGATIVGEAGVATAVPAAVQGKLPEAKDFAHALALFAGFNLAHLPANAIEAIGKQGKASGLSPEEFAKTYDPEKLARIQKVVDESIVKTPAEKPTKESATFTTEKGTELPEGTHLTKPEHIVTGSEGGKAHATVPVRQENRAYRHEKIELTPEERQLIEGAALWEKAGDTAESTRMMNEARQMIYDRLKGEKATPAEVPKGIVLDKPAYVSTGVKDGKPTAMVPVRQENGRVIAKEVELTKGERQLLVDADKAQKTGDQAEAAKLKRKAQEQIFHRLKGTTPAKMEIKAPTEKPQEQKKSEPSVITPRMKQNLAQRPENPTEALEKAEATQTTRTKGKNLDDSISFEPPKVEKAEKGESKGAAFRTAIVDELYPLQKYVAENKATDELPFSKDPYKMARLFKGHQGKAQTFLEYKTFDPDTLEWKGKGFREIIKPFKKDLPGLSKYLVARRAIELEKMGKETGVDIADATEYVKENHSKYEKARKELRDYQNALLDYAEKSGLISAETKEQWQGFNEDYVPFQRVFEPENKEYLSKSMQPKQQFFKLEGSKRNIIDPLESIIGNTYKIIEAAEKNNVVRSLVEFEKTKKGAADANSFIEVKEIGSEEPTLKNYAEYLSGKDVVEGNKVKYFENGKMRTIEVDPAVADVLKGNFTPQEMNLVGKIMSAPVRWIRTGAIALNPAKLARLAIQDQFEAYVYSEVGYKPAYDLVRGIFNVAKKGELYNKWRAAGGDQSLQMDMSRARKQETLQKIANAKHVALNMDGALRLVEEAFKPLEAGTRVSLFERSLEREGQSPDALRKAALLSRDTVLDYAKKGAKTKTAVQAIPFFNAGIQGIDKFIQSFKENPVGATVKATAFITTPTVMLWLYNNANFKKEYQEIPDWEKDSFWNIFVPIPGQEKPLRIKIPKPFELGFTFGTVAEHALDYVDENDPKAVQSLGKSLIHNFTPPMVPGIVRPAIEQYANKSWLTDRPLVPKRLENLTHEEQFTPYTSETAKVIGKIVQSIPYVGDTSSASPIVIDNWIKGMSGGAGTRLIKYTERGLEKAGVLDEKVRPDEGLADLPFVGEFFGHNAGSGASSVNRFYEYVGELEKQYNSIVKAAKEGRQSDIKDKDIIVGKHKQAQKIKREFSKIRKTVRNIVEDNDPTHYTPVEKRILIDQLEGDMVRVSRAFLGRDG